MGWAGACCTLAESGGGRGTVRPISQEQEAGGPGHLATEAGSVLEVGEEVADAACVVEVGLLHQVSASLSRRPLGWWVGQKFFRSFLAVRVCQSCPRRYKGAQPLAARNIRLIGPGQVAGTPNRKSRF